ncbi:MAG: PRC-barrel domain-containing protein [Usitatibacter sp.]
MLRGLKDLQDYEIHATDGNIGHVKDFYFDDEAWVIRYLIVDTGTWLSGRKVLISPISIGRPDWAQKLLPVSITKEQVENSPDIDTEKPVSRQHEMGYLSYYGYQNYWGGAGLWGAVSYPSLWGLGYPDMIPTRQVVQPESEKAIARAEAAHARNEDHHLRSCEAIVGYHIQATDGEIGHVQGLLVDEETWAIRYLVVDTNNWWLGHRVLIAPQWIKKMSWSDTTVSLDLTWQQVKDAPEYDSAAGLDRKQEASIYDHYGRPGYWAAEAKAQGKRETAILGD